MDSNLQESIIQKQQEMLNEMQAKLDIAVEALKEIILKKEMTRFAKCCVHKTCHLNEDTNTCSFQTGINYGYCDQASIASEALEKLGVK